MCTETFLRLPEEKRTRFLDAAWEEFTSVSFADASINKIVLRARIPRGSFYQYFADKEDLFSYLMDIVRRHILGEYRSMVEQAEGDMFRAQLLCYDRFVTQKTTVPDALFEKCLQVLRCNSGIHLQMLLGDGPDCTILNAVGDRLDLSALNSTEPERVRAVFMLTLMALAAAVMDTMMHPDCAQENRAKLETQLEIIRQGCAAASRRDNGYREETV